MTKLVMVFVFYFWLSFVFVKYINFVEGVNNTKSVIYSLNPKIPFISFCSKNAPSNNTQLRKNVVRFTDVFPYNEKTGHLGFYNFDNYSIISHQYKSQFYANSRGLFNCPEGFIRRSTKYFRLFDNGFARTTERFLKAGEYCLNEIKTEEKKEKDEGEEILTSQNYVVQFCIPDLCINGTVCIRKCCPTGFSWMGDANDYKCRPHPVHFNISLLRSEDDMPLKPGPFINNIHYQNFPICDTLGDRIILELKDFSIIPDGRMKYSSKTPTDRYCVDNIFNNFSETVSIQSFRISR